MSETRLLSTCDIFDYEIISEAIRPDPNDSGKLTKKVMMKGVLQKADTLNQNGRVYPSSVLEREIRNYQKFIIENRALGECVPPGTEIFTRDGWKAIETITDDEFVATLNLTTNELEFQRILAKIDMPYKGSLYRFRNARSFDMCVTENHKVVMWDRNNEPYTMSAKQLYDAYVANDSSVSHSCFRRAACVWNGEDPEIINVAGMNIDAKLWAAFLGIYLAEGHCSGVYSKNRKILHTVVITQNVGDTTDKIRDLLTKLPWKFFEKKSNNSSRRDFVITDKMLHEHLYEFGGSRDKYIPLYAKSWSISLQNVLLDWMLLGDGRHRRNSKSQLIDEYCTSSKKLADDVYEIMLKLGDGATIHVFKPKTKKAPDYHLTNRMISAENQAPMNIVSRHSSKNMALDFRFLKVDVEEYDGRVYCVTVPNGTWLMRYNNKTCWTGNCDHPDSSVINLKNVSHVIREAKFESGVVYGTVEVLNTPSGMILQSLIESGVKLGISSRGVGTTKKQGDYQVVQDDFQLICWDFVSEPSTPGAFMIPEGKIITETDLKTVFRKSDRIDRILNDILLIN